MLRLIFLPCSCFWLYLMTNKKPQPEHTLDLFDNIQKEKEKLKYCLTPFSVITLFVCLFVLLISLSFCSFCPRLSWRGLPQQLFTQISGQKKIMAGRVTQKNTYLSHRLIQLGGKLLKSPLTNVAKFKVFSFPSCTSKQSHMQGMLSDCAGRTFFSS